jgi:hypothetical protein
MANRQADIRMRADHLSGLDSDGHGTSKDIRSPAVFSAGGAEMPARPDWSQVFHGVQRTAGIPEFSS